MHFARQTAHAHVYQRMQELAHRCQCNAKRAALQINFVEIDDEQFLIIITNN
jgi:hypothetical protein